MIIAITGTNGAGKNTVVDYLIESRGFFHASAREMLSRELRKRDIPIDRPALVAIADEFRREREPKHCFVASELLDEAKKGGKDAIIESVRTVAEIGFLRKAEPRILIWAVDAAPEIRYERITTRKSPTDKVSFGEFIRQETKECQDAEPWQANLPRCIELADARFLNNGTREELAEQIEKAFGN